MKVGNNARNSCQIVKTLLNVKPTLIFFALQNITDQNVGVFVCIQQGGIPLDDDGPHCIDNNKLVLNTTDLEEDNIYFPYPEPGNWYLSMQAYCYNDAKYVVSLLLHTEKT